MNLLLSQEPFYRNQGKFQEILSPKNNKKQISNRQKSNSMHVQAKMIAFLRTSIQSPNQKQCMYEMQSRKKQNIHGIPNKRHTHGDLFSHNLTFCAYLLSISINFRHNDSQNHELIFIITLTYQAYLLACTSWI